MKYLRFLLIALLIALPTVASAHTLVRDNNIGAVMHIDPDDDPIVGQPATFFFDIKDTQNQFELSQCTCTVYISQNATQLYSTALSVADLSTSSFAYTFAAKGVYGVEVVGAPLNGSSFTPFTLNYTVRVDRTAGTTTSTSSIILYSVIAVLGIGAFCLAVFARRRPVRSVAQPKAEPKKNG